MPKIETIQEQPLFTVTLTGLTQDQRDRVNQFAQGLNGTLPKRVAGRPRSVNPQHSPLGKAAKRGGAGNGRRKTGSGGKNASMIVCPVKGELIKRQGSIQHVRAEARHENRLDELNQFLDALKVAS